MKCFEMLVHAKDEKELGEILDVIAVGHPKNRIRAADQQNLSARRLAPEAGQRAKHGG